MSLLDELEEKWLRFEKRLETIEMATKDTIMSYRHTWKLFREYLEESYVAEISTESIEEFLLWLSEQGYSTNSVRRHYYAVKKFLCWAGYCDEVDWRAIRPKYREEYKYNILSEEEVKSIIDYAMRVEPRYGVMIWLGYEAAMRISELLGTRIRDVDLERAIVLKRPRKREKPCEVPLSRQLAVELANYIDRYRSGARPEDYLFVTKFGRPWNRSIFSKYVFKPIVEELGLLEKYPTLRYHDLRHTRATLLLRRGVDIYTVNKILCHRLLQTTMVYLHLARGEELRERIEAKTGA